MLFQNIVADENKYAGLGISENKFSSRAYAEKIEISNLCRPKLPVPPPQKQMVAPLVNTHMTMYFKVLCIANKCVTISEYGISQVTPHQRSRAPVYIVFFIKSFGGKNVNT